MSISLVGMFRFLSSCGKGQLSYCCRVQQASCAVQGALELWWGHLCTCGGGLLCLSQEAYINLLWGHGAPLKQGSGLYGEEAWTSSQVSVLGNSSLVVFHDSSLFVAWRFLSRLWCAGELILSISGGSSLVVVGDYL